MIDSFDLFLLLASLWCFAFAAWKAFAALWRAE
jgi:hypothetical protein